MVVFSTLTPSVTMALSSTIFKINLDIADLDRNYYAQHTLTVARHPSETNRRMLLRIIAFALHASDDLAFTRGISTDNEPDLWQKNPSGEIELWVELGQPDDRRVRKACGRARRVVVITYASRSAEIWWRKSGEELQRFDNLRVLHIAEESIEGLGQTVQRQLHLHCTIQEGEVWLSDDTTSIQLVPECWKSWTAA